MKICNIYQNFLPESRMAIAGRNDPPMTTAFLHSPLSFLTPFRQAIDFGFSPPSALPEDSAG